MRAIAHGLAARAAGGDLCENRDVRNEPPAAYLAIRGTRALTTFLGKQKGADDIMSHPRFSYIADANGCHIWQKARNNRGYGVVWFDGKVRLAHRVAWFLAHGSWPTDGLVLDHACDTKACVNVDHLREMENWQNIRRRYPAKTDPREEHIRAVNRMSQAKRRGTYSPTYSPERG